MAKRRQKDRVAAGRSNHSDPVWSAFRIALRRLGVRLKTRRGDAVKLIYPSGEQTLNIANIAIQLREQNPESWGGEIETFIKALDPGQVAVQTILARRPFAEINDMIMPCLRGSGLGRWSRELATDLHLLLAIDTPETIMFVTQEDIEASGHSADEWLTTGEQNLIRRTPPDWYEVVQKRPFELRVSTSSDGYAAARSLVLDRLLPRESRHGWIVAPLSRDEMGFIPNRYREPRRIIAELAMIVASRDETAYPVSQRIYTVRDGHWSTQPMIKGPDGMPIFIDVHLVSEMGK